MGFACESLLFFFSFFLSEAECFIMHAHKHTHTVFHFFTRFAWIIRLFFSLSGWKPAGWDGNKRGSETLEGGFLSRWEAFIFSYRLIWLVPKCSTALGQNFKSCFSILPLCFLQDLFRGFENQSARLGCMAVLVVVELKPFENKDFSNILEVCGHCNLSSRCRLIIYGWGD